MICAGFTLPRTSDLAITYFFLIWFSVLALSLIYIVFNGIEYVSWPRLLPLTDIVHYSGPGYRSGYHGLGFGDGKKRDERKRQAKGKSNGIMVGGKGDAESIELGKLGPRKSRRD